MQDYIKGAYLVQTHCTGWAKNQTSLGWFETLAKASSPAQVQLDKNLPLWKLFSGVIYTNVGLCPGQGQSTPTTPRDSTSPQNSSGYSAFINMYKSITGTLKCLWLE